VAVKLRIVIRDGPNYRRGMTRKPRQSGSDDAIVAAAEKLFARHGISAVSLRQIRQQAGAANNFAVQYHFQDREGLVRAVYERRVPELERRRSELLGQAQVEGRHEDPATLIEALLLPLSEILSDDGMHTYAGFQLDLFGLERGPGQFYYMQQPPITKFIVSKLHEVLSPIPHDIIAYRMVSATMLYLDAVVRLDEKAAVLDKDAMINEALGLATAVATAPYPNAYKSLRSAAKMQASAGKAYAGTGSASV
jgi:AcrR family transcriptional regulator